MADEMKVISNVHMEISMLDNASPLLKELLSRYPNSTKIALQSCGKFLKGKIQEGITAKAPGGSGYKTWQDIVRWHKSRKAPDGMAAKSRRQILKKRSNNPLAWVRSNTEYDTDGATFVKTGWFATPRAGKSRAAKGWGGFVEEGHKIEVSKKMRRLFAGAGAGIAKDRNEIAVPARPTIDPVYQAEKNNMAERFSNKFFEYLMKGKG